jgi:hypothetical protein
MKKAVVAVLVFPVVMTASKSTTPMIVGTVGGQHSVDYLGTR